MQRGRHTIAKIGYYALADDGSFKSILIYENPDVDLNSAPSGSTREDLISSATEAHAQAKLHPKPRHSLFSKVVTFFTVEAN